MIRNPLPPGVGAHDRVVLFDGVCNLCNRWVRFLTVRDPRRRLRLAAVQSPSGQAILAWCGLPTDRFDTMVFVEDGTAYTKSEAFLRVVRHLRRPWPCLSLGVVIPRPLRDCLYDLLASNRFAVFGRRETCMVPGPELAGRFLP
jgi:predicted DCC family thiol-disulfide oxidoreductase YuxK